MNGMNNYEQEFLSLFSTTARYHRRHLVFEDFISCSVIALQNRLSFCEKREQKYLRIVSRYEKRYPLNLQAENRIKGPLPRAQGK